jgi:hypothetical protein
VTPALDFEILTQSTSPVRIDDDDFTGLFSPSIVTISSAFDEFEGLLANSTRQQQNWLPDGLIKMKVYDHSMLIRQRAPFFAPTGMKAPIGTNMRERATTAIHDSSSSNWLHYFWDTSATATHKVLPVAKLMTAHDPLASYEEYSAANWDADGAEPITPATLTFARHIMGLLPIGLGQPDVAPAADGSIALEWVPEEHHKLDRLFLDIGPGEVWRAYWMLCDGTFGRLLGEGYADNTRPTLRKLFDDLRT